MEQKINLKPGAFKNTFCVFKEVSPDELKDRRCDYDSKSGSTYYYTTLGMYRFSNHWGRLANSKWRLEPLKVPSESKNKVGFAPWTDFYPDNAIAELYYLEANFVDNTVNYMHKNNPAYDKKAILRSSFETTKKIKQIRNLLNLTSWANYFNYTNLDILRQKIINQMIFTTKTLEEIKREIQHF